MCSIRPVHVLALAAALGALLTACGSGQRAEDPDAGKAPPAPTSTAPAPVKAPASTPSPVSTAALEQAFVLEVMGQRPELILGRAELVTMGHTTCDAFRAKPGTVATLVKNASAAGQTADQVAMLRVVAVAAIHNLCPDQAGDL